MLDHPYIHPITVAYPPQLLRAIGYTGAARFVSLCYSASETTYYDGHIGADACYWPYRQFTEFGPVRLFCEMIGANLGHDDAPPSHALLFDAHDMRVLVGPRLAVDSVAQDQWPPLAALTLAALPPAELERIVREALAAARLSPAQGAAREAERQVAEAAFMAWLHQQPGSDELARRN